MNKDLDLEPLIIALQKIREKMVHLRSIIENQYSDNDWATYLNIFCLLASEQNNIIKIMLNDKSFAADQYAMIPMKLSPELDSVLIDQTQDRVRAFTYEIPPQYLRTMLDPKVIQGRKDQLARTSSLSSDSSSKLSASNKVVDNALKEISNLKVIVETDVSDKPIKNAQINEIHDLFATISCGKNLRLNK